MLRIRVTFFEENLFEIKFEITVFEIKKRSRHPFRSTRFRESRHPYSRHQAFSLLKPQILYNIFFQFKQILDSTNNKKPAEYHKVNFFHLALLETYLMLLE